MGFLKKLFGSKKKEEEKVDEEVIEEPIENKEEVNDEPAQTRNFKYLDNLIHNGVKEIELDSDIVLDDDEQHSYYEGIELDIDNLIIDGNNHTIDACGKTRIFNNIAKNVIIKNITLKNGFAKNGGAINNYVEISFNPLKDNKMGNLEISDSVLVGNSATDGGAIFNEGEIVIRDCNLVENSASLNGGAIFNDGDFIIKNCSLVKNIASLNGGAINNTSNSSRIYNSKFTNNYCQNDAHDISNSGILYLVNSYFNNQKISILNENRIYFDRDDYNILNNGKSFKFSPLKEDQKSFTYLKNLIHSGSEIILSEDIVLDMCNGEDAVFTEGILIEDDNVVIDGNGHKIDAKCRTRVFKVSGKNVVIKNVIIQNGYSEYGAGIYNDSGSFLIMDSHLIDNDAKSMGGALYSDGGEIRIKKTTFEHNIGGLSGGAIEASLKNGFGLIDCIDSIFKHNSANSGGAISNSQIKIEIVGCEFINNQCGFRGSNIEQSYAKFGPKHDESSILLIENSLFYNDLIEEKQSIYISDGHCTCRKTKFQFNETLNFLIYNDEGVLRVDQPIFEDLNNLTNPNFEKLIYNNNILKIFKKDGLDDSIESGPESDIIHLDSDLLSVCGNFTHLSEILNDNVDSNEIILDTDFVLEHPEHDFFEGGIELDHQNLILDGQGHTINANGLSRIFLITGGEITLKNIKFENGVCHKSTFNTDLINGGAINVLCNSSLKIVNCVFNNNISQVSAGAIVNKGDLRLENVKFSNNAADSDGGSIYNYKKSTLVASGCDFENNESSYGGALKNEGICVIDNSNLKGNKSKNGGAIFNVGKLNCDNSIFEYNKSYEVRTSRAWIGGNGGAIYSNEGLLILKKCEFMGNNSTDGGALSLSNECEVADCNFLQNYCERGGAVDNDSNLNISNCNFKDNNIKIIYNDYGDQSEESDLKGAAILNDKNGNISLEGSIFEGSRPDIIYNRGTIALKNCHFEDNHEINGSKVSIYENEKDDWWMGIKFIK